MLTNQHKDCDKKKTKDSKRWLRIEKLSIINRIEYLHAKLNIINKLKICIKLKIPKDKNKHTHTRTVQNRNK